MRTLVIATSVLFMNWTGLPAQDDWRTVAESSGFRATSTYEETMEFVQRLADSSPVMQTSLYGTSGQGRAMRAVVVASDGAFHPLRAKRSGKAVVMIQNGIHSGEIDGKDASLMLLRDIAQGRYDAWLEKVILVVLPIYNVDGHERISPYNRPNQDGPVRGMGFRTTTDGHDLNRDHLKLVTPEARAMVRLFNLWRPHLHVDSHVTDGVDHDWVLTYAYAEAPQVHEPLDHWFRAHMPNVRRATEEAGHRIGPYPSLIDHGDPSKGFSSWAGSPRFSSGYFPLRNRVSILVENHSYKPYEDRVRANYEFLRALIDEVASDAAGLIGAVEASEKLTVTMGEPFAKASSIQVRLNEAPADSTIPFPVYDWYTESSFVTGAPLLRYRRGEVRQIDAPWVHRALVEVELPRPRGYLIEAGWPVIEQRLHDHDLQVEVLLSPVSVDVETIRISNPKLVDPPGATYQGLARIDVDVARKVERREMPAGTLWVPANQPDFEVAVQLLEPEAPDSLVRWGLLGRVLERKEYIEPHVLEDLAQKMLRADPQIEAEWSRALEDPAFAADGRARFMWWYRRTPHWDEKIGLMPAMRVMRHTRFETGGWIGPGD